MKHLVRRGFARGLGLVALSLLAPSVVACGAGTPEPAVISTLPSASVAASSSAPVASASASTPTNPLASAPPAEGSVTFTPPKIEEAKLKNGMRVLLVQRHELPIVSVQIVSDRGADQTAPGVCAFMGAMLTQGTKKHGAIALSDELERIGASVGGGCSYDSVSLGGKVITPKLGALVDLLAEMARTSTFDDKEIERERKKRLTSLAQQNDSPGAVVWRTLQGALYPAGHPYAVPLIGDEAAVKSVKRADLLAARAATLTPAATTVVAAGDVTLEQLLPKLEHAFGDWNETAPAAKETPARPANAAGPQIIIVDRPGAPQSTVQAVRVGVPRNTEAFASIFLTNYVFGGHFASRLNMNLREAHAYTYGAGSRFSMWHGPGPFNAGGEIKTDKTADAIKELFGELTRLRDQPISDEELLEAQNGLIDSLPGQFGTVDETASAVAGIAVQHLPIDEYATRVARYRAVNKADVQRVAKELFRSDDMVLVVVGDAAKIEAPLSALGFGKVEVRRKPAAK